MKEYMMIFRNEKRKVQPSSEQMQNMLKDWQSWIGNIAKQGKYVGTNRLLPEGRTIKPNKIISDGPYMEAKELVGGYLIVKAKSLDEAMEMAQTCPNLTYGGNVEVRTVMSIEADSKSESFLHEKALV
jgi:hypothetical protein